MLVDRGNIMAYAVSVDSNYQFNEMGTTLAEMQAAVGGLIQPIDLSEKLTMWVNEEFIFMPDLELNALASSFFHVMAGGEYAIHGTVIFTGGTDDEGEIMALGETEATLVKTLAVQGYLA